MLLQVLYSVRNERQLVEQTQYNLPFRGFVGLAKRKRPATTILTARAGLVQRQPALSFQRCGSSSSTRLAG